jgi:hypothetical protein
MIVKQTDLDRINRLVTRMEAQPMLRDVPARSRRKATVPFHTPETKVELLSEIRLKKAS